jgi:hypothetical protein
MEIGTMAYKIVKIYSDGKIEESVQAKAPDYETLRSFVGGSIQYVPHLAKIECMSLKRGQMVVNEEGMLHNMPYNAVATAIWRENLGKGPFAYEPLLYGNAIYWAKLPK